MSTPSHLADLPDETPGAGLLAARDRVLLYTRSLNLEPIAELVLAGEALRDIPSGAQGPESIRLAMDALDEQLKTQDAPRSPAEYVQPPLNRRPMLAESMEWSLLRPLFSRPCSRQPDLPDHDKA